MSDLHASRRILLMHPAHRTIGVSAPLGALPGRQRPQRFAAADPAARPLRVFLCTDPLSGLTDHLPPALAEHLARHLLDCRWRCCAADELANEIIHGRDDLDRFDCLILCGAAGLGRQPRERIERFCRRGGAVIGLLENFDGSINCAPLAEELFGLDGQPCRIEQAAEIRRAPAADGHPILAGVAAFTAPAAFYRPIHLAADATVLLTATAAAGTQPAAWTRSCQQGRVFGTLLSCQQSLRGGGDSQPAALLHLLGNAIAWTTRRAL